MLMFSLPATDELLTAVDFNEVGGGDLVRDVRNQFRGASTLSRGGINAIVSLSVEAGAKCCHIPTSGGKPTIA